MLGTENRLWCDTALDQSLTINGPTNGLKTWTYDKAFNRLTQADPLGLSTYNYDAVNQLQTLMDRTGITTYRYDDLMHQKAGPLGVETLTWDGDYPLFWNRSKDNLFQMIVNRDIDPGFSFRGSDGSVVRAIGSGSGGGALINHYHLDSQSNVQATTDATQATNQDLSWDLFGNMVFGQSANNQLDYGG